MICNILCFWHVLLTGWLTNQVNNGDLQQALLGKINKPVKPVQTARSCQSLSLSLSLHWLSGWEGKAWKCDIYSQLPLIDPIQAWILRLSKNQNIYIKAISHLTQNCPIDLRWAKTHYCRAYTIKPQSLVSNGLLLLKRQ